MKNRILKTILLIGLVSSSLCAKEYSQAGIYDKMCQKCHGKKAEGNPEKKAPALNDLTLEELDIEILNMTLYASQSFGIEHEIMEHNMKIIIEKKGMVVDSKKMAEYIFDNFYVEEKKK